MAWLVAQFRRALQGGGPAGRVLSGPGDGADRLLLVHEKLISKSLPAGDIDRQLDGFEAFVDALGGYFMASILSAQQYAPRRGVAGPR